MHVVLVYEEPGKTTRQRRFPLHKDATLGDLLRAAQRSHFEIGYMKVWVNSKAMNNPSTDLRMKLADDDIVRIEVAEKWII